MKAFCVERFDHLTLFITPVALMSRQWNTPRIPLSEAYVFKFIRIFLIASSFPILAIPYAFANDAHTAIASAGVNEHIGSKISIDRLRLIDHAGQTKPFADYFQKDHPVILLVIEVEPHTRSRLVVLVLGRPNRLKLSSLAPEV